jgi:hydrogenase/urease accessory protein HupE
MTSDGLRILAKTGMLLGILVLSNGGALAHDPGLSAADVRVRTEKIVAEISFAPVDLERIQHIDSNGDGAISDQELQAAAPKLASVADRLLHIECDHRRIGLRNFKVEMRDGNSVHFILEFANESTAELQIGSPALIDLPRGHKQFFSVRDQQDKLLTERMLSADSKELTIHLRRVHASTGVGESIFRFLALGIDHILTGYDHLAFLLAVLLGGATLRSNAKIITSFTVAHSITLALATLGLVSIPPSVVEPLIAVSIVFVAVENVIGCRLAARWLVTFGFGLIHGLGFASVLRDLGIGATGAPATAIPLLSFNLGVEFAQIAIATLALPLFWKLRQRASFVVGYASICSLVLSALGCYWLIERTLLK